MHIGREPGTGISVAWSSATMFQPNSSAARAGKAASRSRVTVNSPLTMSSGSRSLASMRARSSSSVAARISAASLRLTVVAPRMPWRRGKGVVMAPNVAALVRLMLVTDDRLVAGRDLVALARAAEAGGATSVQLRLKAAPAREQVALARALVAALRVPVLVNDRPDVALAAGAAGVHLGPDDLPVGARAAIAPPGFVIGASVGSEAEAAAAARRRLLGHRAVAGHHHQGRRGRRARRRRASRGWRDWPAGGRAWRSGRSGPRTCRSCVGPAGRAWRWSPASSAMRSSEASSRGCHPRAAARYAEAGGALA